MKIKVFKLNDTNDVTLPAYIQEPSEHLPLVKIQTAMSLLP